MVQTTIQPFPKGLLHWNLDLQPSVYSRSRHFSSRSSQRPSMCSNTLQWLCIWTFRVSPLTYDLGSYLYRSPSFFQCRSQYFPKKLGLSTNVNMILITPKYFFSLHRRKIFIGTSLSNLRSNLLSRMTSFQSFLCTKYHHDYLQFRYRNNDFTTPPINCV